MCTSARSQAAVKHGVKTVKDGKLVHEHQGIRYVTDPAGKMGITAFYRDGTSVRVGDWICRGCANHNYADKTTCNRCKGPYDPKEGVAPPPRPGGGVSAVDPADRQKLKTLMCRDWKAEGSWFCGRGDQCWFAHGYDELRSRDDPMPEPAPAPAPAAAQTLADKPYYKVNLCHHFQAQGTCWNADKCVFAHGKKELRTPADNKPKRAYFAPPAVPAPPPAPAPATAPPSSPRRAQPSSPHRAPPSADPPPASPSANLFGAAENGAAPAARARLFAEPIYEDDFYAEAEFQAEPAPAPAAPPPPQPVAPPAEPTYHLPPQFDEPPPLAEGGVWPCQKCQTDVPAAFRFCPQCGSGATWSCGNCHTTIPGLFRFCPECGSGRES